MDTIQGLSPPPPLNPPHPSTVININISLWIASNITCYRSYFRTLYFMDLNGRRNYVGHYGTYFWGHPIISRMPISSIYLIQQGTNRLHLVPPPPLFRTPHPPRLYIRKTQHPQHQGIWASAGSPSARARQVQHQGPHKDEDIHNGVFL